MFLASTISDEFPFSSSLFTSSEKDYFILVLLPWAFKKIFYFSLVTLMFYRFLYPRLDDVFTRSSWFLDLNGDYLEVLSEAFSFKFELFITSIHFDMMLFFYLITFRFWTISEKLLSMILFMLMGPALSNIIFRLLLYRIAFISSSFELLSSGGQRIFE